jgi:hypothetical protein
MNRYLSVLDLSTNDSFDHHADDYILRSLFQAGFLRSAASIFETLSDSILVAARSTDHLWTEVSASFCFLCFHSISRHTFSVITTSAIIIYSFLACFIIISLALECIWPLFEECRALVL